MQGRGTNEPNASYRHFSDMYQANYSLIYQYVLRMTKYNTVEAEELTQEVFWVAYEKWDYLKTHPNIPGFLIEVAKNKLRKWGFKRRREFPDESVIEEANLNRTDRSNGYNEVELYESIEKILSKEELKMLLNYYSYGYRSRELAKALGITESCFKVRIARMKEKLKHYLKGT